MNLIRFERVLCFKGKLYMGLMEGLASREWYIICSNLLSPFFFSTFTKIHLNTIQFSQIVNITSARLPALSLKTDDVKTTVGMRRARLIHCYSGWRIQTFGEYPDYFSSKAMNKKLLFLNNKTAFLYQCNNWPQRPQQSIYVFTF